MGSTERSTSPFTPRMIAIDHIERDPNNRAIDEADEDFKSLVDSVRVLGILQPVHVRAIGVRFALIDGERRYRAARACSLKEIPALVSTDQSASRHLIAGIALNDQRKAHGPLQIAKRLHEIKQAEELTTEELAKRMGMPLDRVKSYSALCGCSEFLITFLEQQDVPLKIAGDMMRFEKALGPVKIRQLVARHKESPLTREQISAVRKRIEHKAKPAGDEKNVVELSAARRPFLTDHLKADFRRDPVTAIEELTAFLAPLGYLLVQDASLLEQAQIR